MKRINQRLSQLYKLLFDLEDKLQDSEYWMELEKALRKYLHPSTEDEEDAFNKLLMEIFQKTEKFVPARDCKDSFCQKVYLLRLAYCNHKLKNKRSEIAEEIRILKYKEKISDLTFEEMVHLDKLIRMKKKL